MRTHRPYLEGVRFKIRTDHAALRWILTITESTGRLTRWRLLLSEFDYEIDYIPGRVNSVPDAMSRVLTPAGDPQPVEADVPVFESNDHYDADCDHSKVLVTTRNRARAVAQKNTSGPTASAEPPIPGVDTDGVAPPSSDKTPGEPGPADDVDFDIFDFDIQREGDDIPDARDLPAHPRTRRSSRSREATPSASRSSPNMTVGTDTSTKAQTEFCDAGIRRSEIWSRSSYPRSCDHEN